LHRPSGIDTADGAAGAVQTLSLTESSVIARLATDGPATTADLARAESVKPQSMGTIVAALEEMGLVERKPHPTDGRQLHIRLTPKGVAFRKSVRDAKGAGWRRSSNNWMKTKQEILFKAGEIIKPPSQILSKTMPITKLDPTAALVVINLQKGIAATPTAHRMSEIINRSAQLAQEFRRQGLPVVLVNVTGVAPGRTDSSPRTLNFPDDWTKPVPELAQQASDRFVSKQRVGAFAGTDLYEYLCGRNVTQI